MRLPYANGVNGWLRAAPVVLSPLDSFRKTHGALPFRPGQDLQAVLPSRLHDVPGLEARVRLILAALALGLDPAWVRPRLPEWGVHPASVIAAESQSTTREALRCSLMPADPDWTFGTQVVFRGAKLVRGLSMKALVLDGCRGLSDLPEDLCAEVLSIQHCQDLRRLGRLPVGVGGLWIENATNLVELPEVVQLRSSFHLSACPGLRVLPQVIRARDVKISHCPGLQSITSKVKCERLQLEGLFQVVTLHLDLDLTGDLDLTLPSLQQLWLQGRIGSRLRVACPGLRRASLDLRVEELAVIETCKALEEVGGWLELKGGLQVRRNPQLRTLPSGVVGAYVDLVALPALLTLDSALLSSSRAIHIRRCDRLQDLPELPGWKGHLTLLDLPALSRWPASLELRALTVLGCPRLPPPPPILRIHGAHRRADTTAREAMRLALDIEVDQSGAWMQELRGAIRTLSLVGVSYNDVWHLLRAEGRSEEDLAVALLQEGADPRFLLERCAHLTNGRGGEVRAARACTRLGIHPGSLALVVKDPVKARWLMELFSESRDLLAGWRGDGGLRLDGPLAWDLPEDLLLPGRLRIHDVRGPAIWPERMTVLGGILVKSSDVQPPPCRQVLGLEGANDRPLIPV